MSEPTLAMKYADLAGEVGLFLGFGRGAALGDLTWTTAQQAAIDSCMKSGLRQFYYPEPLENETTSYDWSFLKPVAQVLLPANQQTVLLYDDFGGLEGQFYVFTVKTTQWWPLDLRPIGAILEKYAQFPTTSGRPQMAALEWLKTTGATQGQRQQLHVWPVADQAYTIKFQYYVNPDYLNTAFPYHMGGAQHAETVRAACLMAAEEFLDDAMTTWHLKYQDRLAASVASDRKSKPERLGYNGDGSDWRRRWHRGDQHGWSPITYRGVQY